MEQVTHQIYIEGICYGFVASSTIFMVVWFIFYNRLKKQHDKELVDQRFTISRRIMSSSHWYCGRGREKIGNALFIYGLNIEKHIHCNDDTFRFILDELGDECLQASPEKTKKIIERLNLKS